MGILNKGGQNRHSRAQSIISGIGKKAGTPTPPPVDGIEPTPPEPTPTPPEPTPTPPEPTPTPPEPTPTPTPPAGTPPPEPKTITPPEPTPTPPEPKPVETPSLSEISDEIILSKLSETLGRKIENYDDLKPKEIAVDPELKQLLEWKEKTGLSLSQWTEYNKDFSQMSDLDVARETLSQKYPTFSEEEINFELSSLVVDDYDDDSEKMRKNIELKKLAIEGRQKLESQKFELKPNAGLTEEQTSNLDFAKKVRESQAQAKTTQEAYESNLNLAAQNLDTISLNLAEGIHIDHKVADADKNGLKDFVLTVPHWYNEDGTPNHANIASDGYKIKNFDSLLKIAFEQGKASQLEASIAGNGKPGAQANVKPQGGQGEPRKGNINSVVDKLAGTNKKKFRFRK